MTFALKMICVCYQCELEEFWWQFFDVCCWCCYDGWTVMMRSVILRVCVLQSTRDYCTASWCVCTCTNKGKKIRHSQWLPGVGIERGVFGVPGTSKTSSLNDFENTPFCLTTGKGNEGVLFLFNPSSFDAVAAVVVLWSWPWGKLVSSIAWLSSSASKSETSNLLMFKIHQGCWSDVNE